MKATPAKLRSGAWGARIQGTAKVGDVVQVTTSTGKSWQARVTEIVWSGSGVTLAATVELGRPLGTAGKAAPRSDYRRGSGAGSAAPVVGYSSYCTDRPGCRCYDCAS